MLRVTVDLVPFGFEDSKRNLYKIEIANVKTFANNKANYKINLNDDKSFLLNKFDRDDGALALVKAVLDKISNEQ